MAKTKTEPNLRSQWLGEKMRDLRKACGVSQADAADYIQRDATMLGRYENGIFPFRRVDVLGLLTLYGVDDEKLRDGLLEICDEAWRKDWWDEHRKDLGTEFIDVPWLESRAERICTYQHLLVYGLLQTRPYAEAVINRLEHDRASAAQIDRWIDLRIERQQILEADSAPRIDLVLEEAVLHRTVGSAQVMRGQLQRLLDTSDRPGITIRIIPTEHGPHAGLNGSFELFSMPEPYPAVAYVETTGGSLYLEAPKVSNFEVVWDDLDRAALAEKRSVDLIAKRLKEIR
ncbi:helix-turn-helix domain-containing protein [Glycomyces sp. A-F 0318]|uniref:helix-turn-helix domain-containing protein n=1 Tax=Glycomyces amatae TaxID=2881355 RepID=UPI001E5D5AC1|nr:helix-turn-helix transcriptional regulator [Glycomyces amatae]MCD0443453.1 helix-turn-helix domain-containing protein [Glycomyces amatae]